MKYLKLFEAKLNRPEIGDYVICDSDELVSRVADFISTHIGRYVIKINSNAFPYIIYYEEAPSGLIEEEDIDPNNRDKHIGFSKKEILFFSKNKEDCEAYLAAKKYNL